jgi:hypothetical protein
MLLTRYIKETFDDTDTFDDDAFDDDTSDDDTYIECPLGQKERLEYLDATYMYSNNVSVWKNIRKLMDEHTTNIIKVYKLIYINDGLCFAYPVRRVILPWWNYKFIFQFNDCLIVEIAFAANHCRDNLHVYFRTNATRSLEKLNKEWNRLGMPKNIIYQMLQYSLLDDELIIQ